MIPGNAILRLATKRAASPDRALFLVDRVSLVNQTVGAFKAHLPEPSPVNLVTEKDTEGRVYVCTYPTILNMIDQTDRETARFGVGHFDLVIIYEALYDSPFTHLHAGGPDALFAGRDEVVEELFQKLQTIHSSVRSQAG